MNQCFLLPKENTPHCHYHSLNEIISKNNGRFFFCRNQHKNQKNIYKIGLIRIFLLQTSYDLKRSKNQDNRAQAFSLTSSSITISSQIGLVNRESFWIFSRMLDDCSAFNDVFLTLYLLNLNGGIVELARWWMD